MFIARVCRGREGYVLDEIAGRDSSGAVNRSPARLMMIEASNECLDAKFMMEAGYAFESALQLAVSAKRFTLVRRSSSFKPR